MMEDIHESAMQPLTNGNEPRFFEVGRTFKVRIYEERSPAPRGVGLKSDVDGTPETKLEGNYDKGQRDLSDRTQFEESLEFLTIADLTLGERVRWDYDNLNRDIVSTDSGNHEHENIVFQMRGENEWRNAFSEECKCAEVTRSSSEVDAGMSTLSLLEYPGVKDSQPEKSCSWYRRWIWPRR